SGLCDNTTNKVSVGFYENQMESLDEMFCWLAILWERGLFHENPQVRCLILQSFLSVDWNTHKHYAKHVPRSFITGPLILSLNDVTHHKDFGVGGVYTSKTIQGAIKFVCQYSAELSMSEHLEFICSLASLAREETFGRPGLMAFASFLSSAACTTKGHHENEVPHYENQSREIQVDLHKEHMDYRHLDLLDALGIIIERSKQHFNPNYRLQGS
ncbi:hypothetical protein Taro_018340, partial [Colocasia esculenta]|nr:hypothetical protein [Colocasia esculenta]